MQKKLSSRTVNRTSRTTIRNRVSLPPAPQAQRKCPTSVGAVRWAPWRGRANEASVTYLLTSKCHFELVSVRAPGHPARSRGPVPRHCRGTAAAIPMAMPNTKDGPRPRSNRPTCHTCHSSRAHHGALSGGSAALQRCSSGLKVLAHATTLDDATHQARLWLGSRSTINPPRMATSSVAASIGGPSGSSTRLSPRLMIERARQK